jgi:hypothetical protein
MEDAMGILYIDVTVAAKWGTPWAYYIQTKAGIMVETRTLQENAVVITY